MPTESYCIGEKNGKYLVKTEVSYNYSAARTTDELIQAAFHQGIDNSLFSDSYYTALKHLYGGFAELEARPDAAQKLLAMYVRIMNGEQIFPKNYVGHSPDFLVGMILSRDVHWNRLTQEEKELFASFGLWRDLDDESTTPKPFEQFPGKNVFRYDLWLEGEKHRGALRICYGNETWPEKQDHFAVSFLFSGRYPMYGWSITGWFDEPTEITVTVTDGDAILCREVLLITPLKDGYKIDVLETSK